MRAELALRQGRRDEARIAWRSATEQYAALGAADRAVETRCALARLLAEDDAAAARDEVDAVLAAAAADPRPQRRALPPPAPT